MSNLKTFNVEIDVNDTARTDKIAPPPKKWRNWYRAKCDLNWPISERPAPKRGEIYPGRLTFPSKEIAEQKSAELSRTGLPYSHHNGQAEYLGAEPEE